MTLVGGDPEQVAIIRRIFDEFTELRYSEHRIAEGLNSDGILSPGGRPLDARHGPLPAAQRKVRRHAGLQQDQPEAEDAPQTQSAREMGPDAGGVRGNHRSRAVRQGPGDPGRTPEEVRPRVHARANRRRSTRSTACSARRSCGCGRICRAAATFAQRFGSLDFAFQQLHNEHRDRARQLVHEQICQQVPEVLSYCRLPGARPEAGPLDPAVGADPPRLRRLLAVPPGLAARDRHHAGRAALRSPGPGDSRLRRHAAVSGRQPIRSASRPSPPASTSSAAATWAFCSNCLPSEEPPPWTTIPEISR